MTIFTGGGRTRDTQFISEFEPSTGSVLGAFAEDALKFSPTSSILRAQEQKDAQEGVLISPLGAIMDPLAGEAREEPTTDIVEVEEQGAIIEERFDGRFPIKPVEGMRRATLELLMDRKEEELANQQIISRATTGQLVAGFGAGVLASIVDPLNIATAFVPVIAPARYAGILARQTSRTGRALVRARIGALEGAVGAALVEPFISAQARNEQADYTMADSLLNMAFGTVLGGGLHMGIGAISDGIKAGRNPVSTGRVAEELAKLTPAQREDLFRAHMALAIEDRGLVVPFRLIDILGDARIADAGLVDPGAPLGSTIEFTPEQVTSNARVPPEVDAVARNEDPGLFKLVDEARAEQASLREQLDRVGADRAKSAEIVELDSKITELRTKQSTSNKRKGKKLEKQIEVLEREKADLVATETPVMQKLRGRLVIQDLKLRDIAPEVSAALRQAQDTVRGRGTTTETVFRATGISFDEAGLARLQSVENLRLANTEFTSRIDEEILPEDSFSTVADAEESLSLEVERLNDAISNIDDDAKVTAEGVRDADAKAIQTEIEMDNDYVAQYKKLAMCVGGRMV
jgi:hypothetical protein